MCDRTVSFHNSPKRGQRSGSSYGGKEPMVVGGKRAAVKKKWLVEEVLRHLPTRLSHALMPFQREGVVFALNNDGRVLIGDEMGLGKTIQAIATAYFYRDEWPLLVIVPASVKGPWVDEFEKWLPMVSPCDYNVVRSGTDVANMSAKVTIITYGMLKQPVLSQAVANANFKVVVVDESHYLKNRKAKRTTALQPILQRAHHCILLSGTPALSRPEELYAQLDCLRPQLFGSFTAFAKRYCNAHNDRFGWNTKGASNLDELNKRLKNGIMIRRLKNDVLTQLPPKRRQRISIRITDHKFVKMLEAGFAALKATDDDPDAGRFSSFSLLQELYMDTCRAKIQQAQQYVKGLCEAGGKFIVFAYHVEMLHALEACVASTKTKYMKIFGDTPTHERHTNVKMFQSDATCKVAILSLLAASQGITLTAASTVVFAELHWTPGIIEQAEDRVHRIGQSSSAVNIHFLVTENSLDDILWGTLVRKVGVVSATLDGDIKRLKAQKKMSNKSLDEISHVDGFRGRSCEKNLDTLEEDDDDGKIDLVEAWSNASHYLMACHGEAPITSKQDIRLFFGKRGDAKQKRSGNSISNTKKTGESRVSANTSGASRINEWSCATCTFRNLSNENKCQMCGEKRKNEEAKEETEQVADGSGHCNGRILTSNPRRSCQNDDIQEVPDVDNNITCKESNDNKSDASVIDCESDDDVVITKIEREDGWSIANIVREDTRKQPPNKEDANDKNINSSINPIESAIANKKRKKGKNDTIASAPRAISLFKFCISKQTNRIFLFSREGRPLCVNFTLEDFINNNIQELPPLVMGKGAYPDIAHFVKQYRNLRPYDQSLISSIVCSSVEDGLARHREAAKRNDSCSITSSTSNPKPQSTTRYIPRSQFDEKSTNASKKAKTISKNTKPMGKQQLLTSIVDRKEKVKNNNNNNSMLISNLLDIDSDDENTSVCGEKENDEVSDSNLNMSIDFLLNEDEDEVEDEGGSNTLADNIIKQNDNDALIATTSTFGEGFQGFDISKQLNKQPSKAHGRKNNDNKKKKRSNAEIKQVDHKNKDSSSHPQSSTCKYCKKMIQNKHTLQQTFCSHECWELFNIKTGSSNTIRRRLFELEGGVCQLCGLNTHELFQRIRAIDKPEHRRKVLCSTRFQFMKTTRIASIAQRPSEGDFWQADHINPVCEGGGESDISNFRTLCTPCHSKETNKLHSGSARRKLQHAAKMSKDIRGFFK
eukprot:m.114128 g.114128  ORF g.114128 m.114128 type:complete len:1223 (-) comp12812_c0_seq1:69-3737(-)